MAINLLELVGAIHLSEEAIPEERFRAYKERVESSASSDCCYGADCGDCDCGGYCIDSDCE
ncbi:MAG: hypothetical protein NTW17_00575 [Candidatus Pacearchaeota archaeon]|nr:hypothetical protein [Candidatus Pacearchaeota archaeon]